MNDLYVITEGDGGHVAAGPYRGYEVACIARSGMRRPWRMFWRRQRYWVSPVGFSSSGDWL